MNDIETEIRQAFRGESFQLPEATLPRVLRRRRRRLALATATAAFAVVAGGVALAAAGAPPSSSPAGEDLATDPQARAVFCDQQGTELLRDRHGLREQDRAMPERAITFSEQGQWLNLYLGDRVILSCLGPVGEADGMVQLDVLALADPAATWYNTGTMQPLARSVEGGQSFLVVTVPKDAARVVVELPDGTVVPAEPAIGTRVFVAWLAVHPGSGLGAVEELTVTAYAPDTIYVYEDETVTSYPR